MDPLFLGFPAIIITVAATLLGKFFWDRYLSQTSRVTRREFDQRFDAMRQECELKRGNCLGERLSDKHHVEELIKHQSGCLEDALEEEELVAKRRSQTRRALLCIMMSQLKICEALNVSGLLGPNGKLDCGDISRMMVEMGGIE
jgi:hypothetical protein